MWCCIRHFDLRIVNDCNVVDSEATAMHGEPAASTVAVAAVRPPRTPASRLLLACIKDPITLPDVGKHITSLQGATQAEERIKLLQSLASMQLWEVREGRRLPGADCAACPSIGFLCLPLFAQRFNTLMFPSPSGRFPNHVQPPLEIRRYLLKLQLQRLLQCAAQENGPDPQMQQQRMPKRAVAAHPPKRLMISIHCKQRCLARKIFPKNSS